ncbi:bifunctional DNA primase/polymerase [Virgisporangium aurantiacum]|uniref:DNA primase/polymerase bifunctional N-terminal domain-containing protein n=1 Tax=Virgisporangium aurantiacum TaxID=175570 RepID=A0A8J4DYN1_9ACTN|nr:bifunctional DNA primase/polymerase [Virgisporangium aurantiacum]GIJ53217.1 hypothetical protein Vau01_007330 [Virgisporangium aurantiacum]
MTRHAELYAAAVDLVERHGWRLFLLGRSKRPVANCPRCPSSKVDPSHNPALCNCLTCHGPYAATADPVRLRAIFEAVPGGLLAVATGAGSGLAVVDIDPNHGGRIDPARMPATLCAATGSGGWHLYYRYPGWPLPNSQSRLAAGVDVRGDGGYAVAPPSIHRATKRPYRWANTRPVNEMPRALADACRPAPAVRLDVDQADAPIPIRAARSGARGISSPAALLAAYVAAVERAPNGRRRTTLYGAARGVARMVGAGAVDPLDAVAALTAAGRRAEQTDRDINAAIVGGFKAEHVAIEGIAA